MTSGAFRRSRRLARRDISGRPAPLADAFVSLLIHEGRNVVEIARQAGHSPTMTLNVYAHVFDEFDVGERLSAEDQIRRARESLDVSVFVSVWP
jgi:hypothetical protein